MIKNSRRTKLSMILALALISALLFTAAPYAQESNEAFELEDRIDRLELMIKHIKAIYKFDVTEEELMEGAYKGLLDALDKHSAYFNPEDYESFNVDSSGNFSGIGISVGMRNNHVTIIAPIKGTPGEKAGLKAGDSIKFVDDIDISEYSLEKAVGLMRGEAGTKVKLGVLRENSTEVIYFDIIRDLIKIDPIEYEVIEDDIGYIKIVQFNKNTSEKMEDALNELLNKKVKGFIIDLRNNPGGLLSEAVKTTDYFIDEDLPIVHIEYKGKRKQTYRSKLEKIDNPFVVLIDGGSASASEIFAGAVQDAKSGTLIGTQTYGKGTVQKVISVKNAGGVKLTIAEYLTSSERHIDGVGLTPDIVVENITEENKKDIKVFAPMVEDVKSKKDDKGLNIYGAQQRLSYAGYDVDATGIFDEKTFEAIKKFQQSEDLELSGELDFVTREKLNEKVIKVYQSGTKDLQLEKAVEEILSLN